MRIEGNEGVCRRLLAFYEGTHTEKLYSVLKYILNPLRFIGDIRRRKDCLIIEEEKIEPINQEEAKMLRVNLEDRVKFTTRWRHPGGNTRMITNYVSTNPIFS